jgi:hypothetical protein
MLRAVMKKYRFDQEGDPCDNGSVPMFAIWMGGPTLSGVKDCPIDGFDLPPRTAYVSGEPDTWFSTPARVRYRGQRVTGYLTRMDDDGYVFVPHTDEQHKLIGGAR